MGTGRAREPEGRLKESELDGVQTPGEDVPDAPWMQADDITASPGGIHWGSIGAGVLLALTTFLLLELLAIGSGLLTVAGSGAATSVSPIIGLVAFFIGGYAAGLTGGAGGGTTGVLYAGSGVLQGLLVWALGTVLILTISLLGLGQLFGALGEVVNQLTTTLNPNVERGLSAEAVGDPALVAFFGLLLSGLTAALGGWLGKASPR